MSCNYYIELIRVLSSTFQNFFWFFSFSAICAKILLRISLNRCSAENNKKQERKIIFTHTARALALHGTCILPAHQAVQKRGSYDTRRTHQIHPQQQENDTEAVGASLRFFGKHRRRPHPAIRKQCKSAKAGYPYVDCRSVAGFLYCH